MDGYVSSLPEGVHVDIKQNQLTELASLWELVSGPNKRKFYDLYGQITSLITVIVDEPLIKAAIQFWDPSHRCFTFNEEDMMPIAEEYAMLIRLNLQCPDKVYYRRTRMGILKKLAKIIGIEPVEADGYLVSKGESTGLEWVFLRDFINSHINKDRGLVTLALSIYGLIIFPRVIRHVEMTVIDFFKQVQNHVNPSLAIVAETIRSLNICRSKSDERFMRCLPMLYVWLRSHFRCEKNAFTKAYLPHSWPIKEFYKSE